MNTANYSSTTAWFQSVPAVGAPVPYTPMQLQGNLPLDNQDITANAPNMPFVYGTANRAFPTKYTVVTPPQNKDFPCLRVPGEQWLHDDAPSTWSAEHERVTGEMNGERLLYRNITPIDHIARNGSKIHAAQVESFYCSGDGCQFCKVPKVKPFVNETKT